MDPVTLILTALVAGAGLRLKDAAHLSEADAYNQLMAQLRRALAGCRDAELLLTQHEQQDPREWGQSLAQELKLAGADDDRALIAAAQAVMTLVDAAGSAAGKYSVLISESQNVQIGDRNLQLIIQGYVSGETFRQDPASSVGKVIGRVPQKAPAFQPRDDLLAALAVKSPEAPVVRAMTGMRGVGKSQLAAAYARACIDAGWRLVAWVNANEDGLVLSGLAGVAVAMGIAGSDGEDLALAVRNQLEADGDRCLIVFDDATDLTRLTNVVPSAGRCQVVVTSNQLHAGRLGKVVTVDVFTDAEALSFLAERTGLPDENGAIQLAQAVGYLPLALAQSAAVVAEQHLGYPTFLTRLAETPVQDYLVQVSGDPYAVGVGKAIVLALDAATKRDKTALSRRLVNLIALLSAEGVSRSLLHAAGQLGMLRDDSQAAGPAAVDHALGQLASASLLTFSDDGSAVAGHSLTMRVVLERAAAADDRSIVQLGAGAVRLLSGITRSIPGLGQGRAATRDAAKQILDLHKHLHRFLGPDDTGLSTDLLLLRSWAMERVSQFGDSFSLVVEQGPALVDDCERMLGPDHEETMRARNSLAYGYVEAGDFRRAIPLYELTAADRERLLGANHPDTLSTQNNLAYAYHIAGRWTEVIAVYKRQLERCERVLGSDDPETLTAQNNLAEAFEDAGRLTEAIELQEKTLAGRRRVLGRDHPDTLGSRNNLAHAYRKAGRLDKAISMSEQLLPDAEKVLGPEDWQTHAVRNTLASAYQAAGRLDEAIPMFEQSMAGFEQILGPDHPRSQHLRNNLGSAYQAAGRLQKAIALYKRALASREQALGDTHPDTLTTCSDLGLAYQAAGQLTNAIPLLERALAGREQVLGNTHADTRKSRSDLARAYEADGRADSP